MPVFSVKEEERWQRNLGCHQLRSQEGDKWMQMCPVPGLLQSRLPSGHQCMSLSVLLKRFMSRDHPCPPGGIQGLSREAASCCTVTAKTELPDFLNSSALSAGEMHHPFHEVSGRKASTTRDVHIHPRTQCYFRYVEMRKKYLPEELRMYSMYHSPVSEWNRFLGNEVRERMTNSRQTMEIV